MTLALTVQRETRSLLDRDFVDGSCVLSYLRPNLDGLAHQLSLLWACLHSVLMLLVSWDRDSKLHCVEGGYRLMPRNHDDFVFEWIT